MLPLKIWPKKLISRGPNPATNPANQATIQPINDTLSSHCCWLPPSTVTLCETCLWLIVVRMPLGCRPRCFYQLLVLINVVGDYTICWSTIWLIKHLQRLVIYHEKFLTNQSSQNITNQGIHGGPTPRYLSCKCSKVKRTATASRQKHGWIMDLWLI